MINREKHEWGILLSISPLEQLSKTKVRFEAQVNTPVLGKRPKVALRIIYSPPQATLTTTDFGIIIEAAQAILEQSRQEADKMAKKAKTKVAKSSRKSK